MSVTEFIRRQLQRYRDLLANLTRKNKELYFRESRGHCINLTKQPAVEPEFKELIDEKFRALRSTSESFQELIKTGNLDLSGHFLISETGNPDLVKKLDKVRLADDKFQREFGISGAWLLGPFLCWRDRADYAREDLLISPVFKLPIDVVKDKRKHWKLELEDSSLRMNPSLQLALRQKWGVQLPDEFETEHPVDALEVLKKALAAADKNLHLEGHKYESIPKIPPRLKFVKNEEGEVTERLPVKIEEVLSAKDLDIYSKTTHKDFTLIDVLYIDQLNASRTVLISDYDSIMESTEQHPILSELFLGKPVPGEQGSGRDRIRALDSYKERENHFVVNIDSTQHRAIDVAAKTRAIVIQGPPGTGKSQTITNLIAENLAKGKKVLFVSEKRPALDVVFSRLRQANLASQAVLIHSSDLSKQDLYNSFLELSNSIPDRNTDEQWERTAAGLDRVKVELNGYYHLLESTHEPSTLSYSDLLTQVAASNGIAHDPLIANHFLGLSFHDLHRAATQLDDLQSKVQKIVDYASHPWLRRKAQTIFSETLSATISNVIGRLKQAETQLRTLIEERNRLCPRIEGIPDAAILSKCSGYKVPDEWVSAASLAFSDEESVRNYERKSAGVLRLLEKEAMNYALVQKDSDPSVVRELESYYSIKRGFFDWLTPKFWKMRAYRRHYCPNWQSGNSPFKAFRLVRESIQEFKNLIDLYCIPGFLEESDPAEVTTLSGRATQILQMANELGLIARQCKLAGAASKFSRSINDDICRNLSELRDVCDQIIQSEAFLGRLKSELAAHFAQAPTLTTTDNSAYYDSLLQSLPDLDQLDQVDLAIESIRNIGRNTFGKDILLQHLIPKKDSWGEITKSAVTRTWVDELRARHPELRTFDSASFQRKTEQFQKIEAEHRTAARDIVNNTFSKRWNGGSGETIGLGLLKKEANKQRRVLSPREIMERGALSAMMKLKPCWLMSPLSISQMLPLKAGLFDVIIFDEASQVRVEDAVPSIYRANSMVVVGDPKQMPPTNFFSSGESQSDDDEDEENEIAASILDMAAQIYPSEVLEWHYRSRAEALIAFSNRAFYGGRLIAVPNPHFLTEGEPILFHNVAEGYFNQKSGNTSEAKAVAKRLLEVLSQNPSRSVGVIALGQSQMTAIEDALDELVAASGTQARELVENARTYSDGEADAGLFVKNLENVQGDERDIILISVGYAPSKPGKKLYLNFGPLSKAGGGRRLNVAITRAKEKIEVFCSCDPNQIPTDGEAFGRNPDMVLFGRYLKYASAVSGKRTAEALTILDSFGVGGAITTRKSSNFSKDVQRRLAELGYKVSAEIGSSGFYIDLGIHHPVIPSNFVLGIECDGAMFHSTPYARDRDKIRQELLEARGWKIIRVWSQDWSKDWRSEVAKLDSHIKKIIADSTQPRLRAIQ